MRDSLLRLIDDFETKKKTALIEIEDRVALGTFILAVDYAIKEIRKVLDDYGKSE